jgi:phosphohistidine phosphatase
MIFGHNPEFAELAHRLAPEITEMPTCAVAELRFDARAWADVGVLDPAKVKLDTPKK